MTDEKKIVPIYEIRESKKEFPFKIMIVNTALRDYKFKNEFPWYLWVKIEMKDVAGPNKMPTEKEAAILNSIEDYIFSLIEKNCNVHYVGRVTDKGNRELFYYLDDPKITSSVLDSYFKKNPIREIEYYMENDPDWKIVDFFYS